MPRSIRSSNFRWIFLLSGLLFALPGALPAQTEQVNPAPLRVAVVGLVHGHAEGFFSALTQYRNVELVGIAEPEPALAEKYEKKYGLDPGMFFLDMEQMIESRHPEAVLVYTSISDHRKVIETAAKFGVSEMVEKPLTISLEDVLAIRKVAREHRIHVLVNYETT
jgi:predicted dehydrogenase